MPKTLAPESRGRGAGNETEVFQDGIAKGLAALPTVAPEDMPDTASCAARSGSRGPGVMSRGLDDQPPSVLGHFQLGKELGRGGMGIVCTATDTKLGRRVAIKCLHGNRSGASAHESFTEEAQITAQLEHPGIVPVHELGTDEHGRPWLAMKHVSGATLADCIADWHADANGRLSPSRVRKMIGVLHRVLDAIAFAHNQGVIHRDLKPANIMVGTYGEVMVMDWGLARPLGRGGDAELRERTRPIVATDRRGENPSRTMEGDIHGTPACMAPEQAHGRLDEIDERTDVFALGGLLYHMLTNRQPYEGATVLAVLGKAAKRDLLPPHRRAPRNGIPRELSAIVMKAMATRPADRYESARAFQADLQAWLDHRRTAAFRPGLIGGALKWTRRHPTTTIVGTLLVLFGSLLGGVVAVMHANAETQAARQREQVAASEFQREQEQIRSALLTGKLDDLRRILKVEVEGKRDQALTEFHRALAKRGGDTGSHEAFVHSLGPGKIQQLIDAYDRLFAAHEQAPDQIPVTDDDIEHRGLLHYYGTRDYVAALADFTTVLERNPDDIDSLIYRGYCFNYVGRFADARRDFERGRSLSPADDTLFLIALGVLASALTNYDDAILQYNAALRIRPLDAIALQNRGVAHFHNADLDDAIADYTAALQIRPDFALAYLNRGIAHNAAGHINAALRDLGMAIQNDPAMAAPFRVRAEVNLGRGEWNAAAEDCALAMTRDSHPDNYRLRAEARLGMGDTAGAIADYRQALAIQPDVTVRFSLASALLGIGDFAGAIAEFDQLLEAVPEWAEAMVNRGIAHRGSGNNTAALADFRAAATIKPGLYQAWLNQGIVLCDMRKLDGPDGAREAFNRAIDHAPQQELERIRSMARSALASAGG